MAEAFGFLNIDKPTGMTSHDVVNKIRRGLKINKVGHAGTLDPLASGVLIICLGAATRLSEYAMHSTKQYRAQLRMGRVTTTYDAEGEIVAEYDVAHLTRSQLEAVLPRFTGRIQQIPPLYSAIKQGGRKLYDIARSGESAELTPRPVQIDQITLVEWAPPSVTLEVICGAGTYIRSLAHDLGQILGVGASLDGLVRTASGAFTLADSFPLEGLLANPDWESMVLPPDFALADFPRIDLDPVDTDHVRHGRRLQNHYAVQGLLARAYAPDGTLLAILQADDDHNNHIERWKPHKVFLNA